MKDVPPIWSFNLSRDLDKAWQMSVSMVEYLQLYKYYSIYIYIMYSIFGKCIFLNDMTILHHLLSPWSVSKWTKVSHEDTLKFTAKNINAGAIIPPSVANIVFMTDHDGTKIVWN